MDSNRLILFNHIPKTGGTTLRIVLNRVYGTDRVFFIDSRNISESLEKFSSLSAKERIKYKVISGHGAELFLNFTNNPFKISIIREPISLFISQYYYLKKSSNSNYQEEVDKLSSIDEYLDYAIKNGQDNLLTRYFSNSMNWLVDENSNIPSMKIAGDRLLKAAKSNITNYDFVFDIANFDDAVFQISKILKWKKIPIYRQSNVNKEKSHIHPSDALILKLNKALWWDIQLYDFFIAKKIDGTNNLESKGLVYSLFKMRQKGIQILSQLFRLS